MAARLRLPGKGHLPVTSKVDWIRYYEAPAIGLVFRRRLVWAAQALPTERLRRVLEIGYGSGVFQYELASRSAISVGLDIHESGAAVREKLREDCLSPELLRGDGTTLPFHDDSFDAVVILSALEFMPDPALCLRESRRVLRRGGRLVCITPRELRWADHVFRFLSGTDPESEFHGGRARVQAALRRELPEARRYPRPAGLPGFLAPYEVLVFEGNGHS